MSLSGEHVQVNRESVVEEAKAFIDQIAHSPAVLGLAFSFGYRLPEYGTVKDELTAFKEFTNSNWDFRGGKERWHAVAPTFTQEQRENIFAAAEKWHMVESTEPTKSHYDFLTVPGGSNKSPYFRIKYAKEMMEKHGLEIPYMILLGSARPLEQAEKDATAFYAPGAKDEFDLMNASVEGHFKISHTDEHIINLRNFSPRATEKDMWRVRFYEAPNGMRILSLSAPQIEGERRVNTGDTYLFMQEVVGKEMLEDKDVLNVTTAQFRFQHPDALRFLGLQAGAHIETIGYNAAYSESERQPHELLQEMNSTVNQTVMLLNALEQAA